MDLIRIPGHEYFVDREGGIWNSEGLRLAQHPNGGDGYLTVTLKRGPKRTAPVHVLIAEAKYGNYRPLEVRHLNSNKLDNTWDNIGIGTHQENILDKHPDIRKAIASHAGKLGGSVSGRNNGIKTRRLTSSEVEEVRRLIGKVSYRKLADQFNVSKTVIYNIAKGKSYAV